MVYYATTHEFGDELAVHVFATREERDAWVSIEDREHHIGSYISGYDVKSFEGGPREAITAREARGLFSEDAWETVETVTTHASVRPRGIRRREGFALLPEWLDSKLDRYSVGPREGFGHPDFVAGDVLYQRVG